MTTNIHKQSSWLSQKLQTRYGWTNVDRQTSSVQWFSRIPFHPCQHDAQPKIAIATCGFCAVHIGTEQIFASPRKFTRHLLCVNPLSLCVNFHATKFQCPFGRIEDSPSNLFYHLLQGLEAPPIGPETFEFHQGPQILWTKHPNQAVDEIQMSTVLKLWQESKKQHLVGRCQEFFCTVQTNFAETR